MRMESKIKISRKNYVFLRLNFTVQVSSPCTSQTCSSMIVFFFRLVLAEDAIKAAINDYNTKKTKQAKEN